MKWAMFPDPREQESIKSMEPTQLAEALLRSSPDGNLLASAVYDVLYAEGNREKATMLLKEAMIMLPTARLASCMAHVATFRVYVDGAPEEEQGEFLNLCQEILGVPVTIFKLEPTQVLMARFIREIS
jgi:hypothetical protein